MTFSDDVARFDKKNSTALDFKRCLMTLESIRKELMRLYNYSVVQCNKCKAVYAVGVASDGVSRFFSSPLVGGIPKAGLLTGYGFTDFFDVPIPYSFNGVCEKCFAVGTTTLLGSISGIECNPTVVNQKLNDLLDYSHNTGGSALCKPGTYCGTMVYKFSLHLFGVRSEPVYLVVYSRKERWNYFTDGVAVCRFGSGGSSAPVIYNYDLDFDHSTNLLIAESAILSRIETLLLTK